MKHTWKKAAAFVLATALVAGAVPANVGTGGLFGSTGIVAYATDVQFTNASVTLADDLALNFYVDGIADNTAAAEYTVIFTGACVDGISALTYNATVGKYYATTHVYAKDINQPITAQLYKGDEAVGAPIVTSISDYLTALKTPLAAKMAANPTNPDALTAAEKKLLAIASAAQLFGDASAAYFNPTDTINDTSVAAEITAYMTQANISDAALTAMAAQYAPNFDSDDAKLSLVLDSKTAARLYVKDDYTGTDSTINATKADYPTYHEITELLPQNLADEQTIYVGGTDYTFSALSWCNRVLTNGSASQKNINMAKAIMAYYTAAKAYTTITVTWNNDDITGSGNSFTKDGVTITADYIDFDEKNFQNGGTFTTTLGNFTKIEVTTGMFDEFSDIGWSGDSEKMTWTGNASSVSFSGDIWGMGEGTTKFVFTIEPTN